MSRRSWVQSLVWSLFCTLTRVGRESELREEGIRGVVGNGEMCVAYTKIVVEKHG